MFSSVSVDPAGTSGAVAVRAAVFVHRDVSGTSYATSATLTSANAGHTTTTTIATAATGVVLVRLLEAPHNPAAKTNLFSEWVFMFYNMTLLHIRVLTTHPLMNKMMPPMTPPMTPPPKPFLPLLPLLPNLAAPPEKPTLPLSP